MKYPLLAALLMLAFSIQPAHALDQADAQKILDTKIRDWMNAPVVINAIHAQNSKYANITQDKINAMDAQWQQGDQAMIDSILNNELSKYLQDIVINGEGLYSEIFVMDKNGLNVGQSAPTSDFWQGDEAKWQETYLKGAGSMNIGEVEFDESSQTYQFQLSLPVLDGEQVIGAITIGLNADLVEEMQQ